MPVGRTRTLAAAVLAVGALLLGLHRSDARERTNPLPARGQRVVSDPPRMLRAALAVPVHPTARATEARVSDRGDSGRGPGGSVLGELDGLLRGLAARARGQAPGPSRMGGPLRVRGAVASARRLGGPRALRFDIGTRRAPGPGLDGARAFRARGHGRGRSPVLSRSRVRPIGLPRSRFGLRRRRPRGPLARGRGHAG